MDTQTLLAAWRDEALRYGELARVLAVAKGEATGRAVLAGTLTPELAGDAWLEIADVSHECGEAFLVAYDRTGAPR